jgi:hypothetical protein
MTERKRDAIIVTVILGIESAVAVFAFWMAMR